MAWWSKLKIWKGLSDLVLYIFFLGFFTKTITEAFYPLATFLILPGLISTIVFLVKNITRDKND